MQGEGRKIFQYLDYRSFLKDRLDEAAKKHQKSLRSIAREADFKTHTLLVMVLKGKRNLSHHHAQKLAEVFTLTKPETDFLLRLIDFADAHTLEERDRAYRELLRFKAFQEVRKVGAAEYEYFSHWYVVAILEAIGTTHPRANAETLAEALGITTKMAEDALNLLKQLGLLAREGGRWIRQEKLVEAYPEVSSIGLRNFHRGMIQKAFDSVDAVDPKKRVLMGLSLGVRASDLEAIRKKCFEFGSALNLEFSSGEKSDRLYQLNLQFFPLIDGDDE